LATMASQWIGKWSHLVSGFTSRTFATTPYFVTDGASSAQTIIQSFCCNFSSWRYLSKKNENSVASVRERTIPTERPPLVSEISAKFADRGCNVVIVTDRYGRILCFLDQSCYFLFQIPPQLYLRDWVDPVPDALLLRKSGSVGNRTRTSGSVTRNSDH
jgi:hypothetical protein